MKSFRFLALCPVILTLVACNDYGSPKGVLGSAFLAIQKNDLKGFTSTLSGDAQAQYGSAEGLNELKGFLGQYETVVLGAETQLSRKVGRGLCSVHISTNVELDTGPFVIEDTEVEILGKTSETEYTVAKKATVECQYCSNNMATRPASPDNHCRITDLN